MNSEQLKAKFDEWLESKPEPVRALARRFPPGAMFDAEGDIYHLVGYSADGGSLLVSHINPAFDYSGAHDPKNCKHICVDCLDNVEDNVEGHPNHD